MEQNKKIPWLKLILWGAIIIHIILISLSFLEVAIYSMVIKPGKGESFYMEHAQITAPYISIIFGIPLFYFVAKFLSKNKRTIRKKIGVWLALIYIITDLVILFFSNVNWGEMYFVFIISYATKFVSSYIGAISVKEPK